MKRRIICIICLVCYILISCTLLSLKIEQEMLTQAEVMNVKGDPLWDQQVSISQAALFEDEDGGVDIDLAGDYYGEVDFTMQYKNIKGETHF